MDGQKFDTFTRSLAISRRAAITGALAGVSGLIGLRAQTDAARRGYSGPNFTGCTIGGVQYTAGAVNPSQDCQVCTPLSSSSGWSTRGDGAGCSSASAGTCCGGVCCGDGQCCDAGICGACGCSIGGQPVAPGTTNPNNPCQTCDPAIDPANWSAKSNSDTCDADGFQFCCEGACCGRPGECCHADGLCWPCFCVIGGVIYQGNESNPLNPCERCAPPLSLYSWANWPTGEPCGNGNICCGDRVCKESCG